MRDSIEKLREIRRELEALFIERDELIKVALVAAISGQHVLLLGPPGTAKSMLARELCLRIGGEHFFQWLLTKFTTPEEIFGPISLEALEQGRYERITASKLPEAHVAFLDEIFKASSAILNTLLTIMNERRFHQGSEVMEVPLRSLIAASNELPDEEELGALYDRFLLRYKVGYIEQDHRFARLLRTEARPTTENITCLTAEELSSLRELAEAVVVPDGVIRDLIDIRRSLNSEGLIASDRRYRQSVDVLKASALLEGRNEVTSRDVALLCHMLWRDPEEQARVAEIIGKVATGFDDEAQRLMIQAEEIRGYTQRSWPSPESRSLAILEAHTKLRNISKRLEALRDAASERGRETEGITATLAKISELQRLLLIES